MSKYWYLLNEETKEYVHAGQSANNGDSPEKLYTGEKEVVDFIVKNAKMTWKSEDEMDDLGLIKDNGYE